MNQTNHPHRPALAALLSATALVATPVFAQEAAPVAPPAARATPVVPVPAPPEPVAATPQPAPVAAPALAQQTGDSQTPINPEAAAAAEAEEAAQRPARAAPRDAPRQPAARVERVRPAVALVPTPTPLATATAPSPAPAPSPSADVQPVAAAPTEADPVTPAPTAAPAPAPADRSGAWPWLLVGLAVLAGAFFFLRRRRAAADVHEEGWAEPAHVTEQVADPVSTTPAYVAPAVAAPAMLDRTPVAVHDAPATTPAVDETATVTDATGEDVAALTAAAPVGDRPWLEFAMRPIRAGTNADEAIVEIELTVGNAGQVAAHDVRISTFMLDEGDRSEMERLLVTPPAGAEVEPVTIDPGEGTRIDATLGLLKSSLSGDSFRPIVVADARYRMADGSEGRTSASFQIGVTEAGTTTLSPIDTARPLMREDIEARLFRDPDHA